VFATGKLRRGNSVSDAGTSGLAILLPKGRLAAPGPIPDTDVRRRQSALIVAVQFGPVKA